MCRKLVLIADKTSKRCDYFVKASQFYSVDTQVVDFDECNIFNDNENYLVKIDPVKIQSNNITELDDIVEDYTNKLNQLECYNNITFFNSPQDILLLLDKYKTKKILENANIPTTPLIDEKFNSVVELFLYLKVNDIDKIFIKPRFGSGACGIVALKYNKKLNQAVIYSTIVFKNNEFYNGNKTVYYNRQDIVAEILEYILSTPIVIEKWIEKKKFNKLNYDLRVVMFKNEVLYIIPRGANSPITNLHLNNQPLDRAIITNISDITLLCQNVMSQFDNLSYAGIDVLITPKNELFIIEVNAQGDAIYNDFYDDNSIYKRQILHYLKGEFHE